MSGLPNERVVDVADRLDRALVPLVGSRGKAADALKAGRVRLGGEPVSLADASRVVEVGAVLTLDAPGHHNSRKALVARRVLDDAGIVLLAEGRSWFAISKPAGLLTDAATFKQKRHEATATAIASEWLEQRRGPGAGEALPAHRIDRDTSGVILFATTTAAETHLRDQFAAHTPERVYLAAVAGKPEGPGGTWRHTMRWDPEQNRQLPARADEEGATEAEANWRVIAHARGKLEGGEGHGRASLLEVRLTTGRRNQIRLQAALEGHPLLGERLYHPPRGVPVPPIPGNTPLPPRQALHAHALTFIDPDDGTRHTVTAPPPADLARLLNFLGWKPAS
jgi:23S rRNA pseudouridine1911/1915/1917 synthase